VGLDTPANANHSKRGNGAIIVVLILVTALGFGAWYLYKGSAAPVTGALTTAELAERTLPRETAFVFGVNPTKVATSPVLGDLMTAAGLSLEELRTGMAEKGVPLDKLEPFVLGLDAREETGYLAIQAGPQLATLKEAIRAAAEESAKGDTRVPSVAFETVGDGLLIAGDGPLLPAAAAVLKGQADGGFTAQLKTVTQAVDLSAGLWVAGPMPPEDPDDPESLANILGHVPTHVAASVDLDDAMTLRVAVLAPGMDAAKAIGGVRAMLDMLPTSLLPDGASEVLKSLRLDGRGEVVSVSMRVPGPLVKEFAALVEQ
jgi:hypothetical protein